MATKSFVTEFKFTAKSGRKLVSAIENSKPITPTNLTKRVQTIESKEDAGQLLDSFLQSKG